MNTQAIVFLSSLFLLPVTAQIRKDRKSLIDVDPKIVQLLDNPNMQITLKVIANAPIYSDINGKSKLGEIRANQEVRVEAITDRAYKVRGKGTVNDVAGWVGPGAFAAKDPNFVANLKSFYTRQLEVNKLIAEKKVAMGMTSAEVTQALGKPEKTTVKQDAEGESGKWEFIEYAEQKNYNTIQDPVSGQIFRQLVSVTQIEKSKHVIEFSKGVVSSIESTEDKTGGGNVRIVVPPIVFCW